MPINNEMIEKPKLGLFQRIRKVILIRRINSVRYNKAPEYLKNDRDVIDALIDASPLNIRDLDLSHKLRIIDEREDLFDRIPISEKDIIIAERPEFVARLPEYEVWTKVLEKKQRDLIKYLPKELQLKLLTEEIPYSVFYGRNSFDVRTETSKPDNWKENLEYFSPEVIEEATIMFVEQAKTQKGYNWNEKRHRVPLLSSMRISGLPVDLQIKLALIDNEFVKQLSPEAAEKFVGDNPLVLKLMSEKMQIEFVKKHPEYFSVFDLSQQSRMLDADYELKKIISDGDKLRFKHKIYDKFRITDSEVAKTETIRNWRYRNVEYMALLTDNVRDRETLIELVRFEPAVLSTLGIDDFKSVLKINHVMDLFKSMTKDEKILEALEYAKYNLIKSRRQSLEKTELLTDLAKVLLNEKVMASCEPEMIAEFIREPSFDRIVNIAAKTYGEDVREIFKDRPLVNIDQIQNLDIFDKRVREKFGNGVVHNLISYDSHSSAIIGDLMRHPEKMKKFEVFEKATEGYYNDSFVDLEEKLYSFKMLEELMQNITEADLTPERKNAIKLAANDVILMGKNGGAVKNELGTISLKTLEDLDNYEKRRSAIYNDYVLKVTSPDEIKESICRRFFGIDYNDRSDYSPKTVTAVGMVNYYNLESFISDERTIESKNFSEDELDTLELITIISKIKDADVLKKIYARLAEREDGLKPVDFKELKEKIPMQYSKELVDSLLTVDNAKKRSENGEQGISYKETEDGYEIVTLDGADFRIMVHSTSLSAGPNNSGITIPYELDEEDVWKRFENGCSTISACVIEPDMLHSCASLGKIHLGFSSVPPKQIIGMSHHDAHVAHRKRTLDPYFEYNSVKFNYPDELVRKTAAQIEGVDGEQRDMTHKYNEVAMYRRDTNAGNIENGTYGGRIMPDYIIVYGEANDYHKKLAKSFSKNGKPIPIVEIKREAYYDRTYQRAFRKENHSAYRESGKFIQEIKELASSTSQESR